MRQRDESVVHTFVMESSAGVCDENEKRTAVHTNLVVGSLDENDATSRTDTTGSSIIMINVLVQYTLINSFNLTGELAVSPLILGF